MDIEEIKQQLSAFIVQCLIGDDALKAVEQLQRENAELKRISEHRLAFINEFGETFGCASTIKCVKYDLDNARKGRQDAWDERERLRGVITSLQRELKGS